MKKGLKLHGQENLGERGTRERSGGAWGKAENRKRKGVHTTHPDYQRNARREESVWKGCNRQRPFGHVLIKTREKKKVGAIWTGKKAVTQMGRCLMYMLTNWFLPLKSTRIGRPLGSEEIRVTTDNPPKKEGRKADSN